MMEFLKLHEQIIMYIVIGMLVYPVSKHMLWPLLCWIVGEIGSIFVKHNKYELGNEIRKVMSNDFHVYNVGYINIPKMFTKINLLEERIKALEEKGKL